MEAAAVNPLAGDDHVHDGKDEKHDEKKCTKLRVQKPNTNVSKAYADLNPHKDMTAEEFEHEVACMFHSDTYALSGSADEQLSADVLDVKSFGLPKVSKDSAAASGGAMTNALQAVLASNSDISFGDAMIEMRSLLKEKKYTQIPQLSCSHNVKLRQEKFNIISPLAKPESKKKAVCIGINYTGEEGELGGCVNDCKSWVRYLGTQGFNTEDKDCVRYLTDDKEFSQGVPYASTILKAMKWLVKDAKAGDSLFFSISCHGVQLKDDAGEEADGYDEALAPSGYQLDGFIRDENIFNTLVAPLEGGVRLCHSGTMLDLPHTWVADDANIAALRAGDDSMLANAFFDFNSKKDALKKVAEGVWDAIADAANTVGDHKWCSCC